MRHDPGSFMSERTTASVFLISYDNCEDWEDRWISPRLIVPTRAMAERIMAEITQWLDTQRALLPEGPEVYSQDMSDEEFKKMMEVDSRLSAHIEALTIPYGFDEMKGWLEAAPGHGNRGRLTITELPFLQNDVGDQSP